jgi:hypothetical protein
LAEESMAASEWGWIDGGGGGGWIDERKLTALRGNLACNNCNALCRIIASVCKRSNGDHDDGICNVGCFSILIVWVERGFKGIGRAIVG